MFGDSPKMNQTGSIGVGLTAPSSPLESELNQLDAASSHLSDTVLRLEKRLSQLLRPSNPVTQGEKNQKQPLSIVPDTVRSIKERIVLDIHVIENLLERLEI